MFDISRDLPIAFFIPANGRINKERKGLMEWNMNRCIVCSKDSIGYHWFSLLFPFLLRSLVLLKVNAYSRSKVFWSHDFVTIIWYTGGATAKLKIIRN